MNYIISEEDFHLLREIKDCFIRIGFGEPYGLLGNSTAQLRDLLCNDENCYEYDPDSLKPRKCTLNDHDLSRVKILNENIRKCLEINENDKLYDRLAYLINKIDEKKI